MKASKITTTLAAVSGIAILVVAFDIFSHAKGKRGKLLESAQPQLTEKAPETNTDINVEKKLDQVTNELKSLSEKVEHMEETVRRKDRNTSPDPGLYPFPDERNNFTKSKRRSNGSHRHSPGHHRHLLNRWRSEENLSDGFGNLDDGLMSHNNRKTKKWHRSSERPGRWGMFDSNFNKFQPVNTIDHYGSRISGMPAVSENFTQENADFGHDLLSGSRNKSYSNHSSPPLLYSKSEAKDYSLSENKSKDPSPDTGTNEGTLVEVKHFGDLESFKNFGKNQMEGGSKNETDEATKTEYFRVPTNDKPEKIAVLPKPEKIAVLPKPEKIAVIAKSGTSEMVTNIGSVNPVFTEDTSGRIHEFDPNSNSGENNPFLEGLFSTANFNIFSDGSEGMENMKYENFNKRQNGTEPAKPLAKTSSDPTSKKEGTSSFNAKAINTVQNSVEISEKKNETASKPGYASKNLTNSEDSVVGSTFAKITVVSNDTGNQSEPSRFDSKPNTNAIKFCEDLENPYAAFNSGKCVYKTSSAQTFGSLSLGLNNESPLGTESVMKTLNDAIKAIEEDNKYSENKRLDTFENKPASPTNPKSNAGQGRDKETYATNEVESGGKAISEGKKTVNANEESQLGTISPSPQKIHEIQKPTVIQPAI